jgi:DNA-binding LacI/PurR family transcriptional regulator/anti-anti-sigma regulatory factor
MYRSTQERTMAGTRIIGVIAPLLGGGFVAPLLDGIHAVAQRHGVRVIVCEGSPASVGTPRLAQDLVAGWILFLDVADVQQLTSDGTPVVAISAAGAAAAHPTVLPDNWGGIQAVMRHLFEHGHERIAFIGTMGNADIKQRYVSYKAALADRGLPFDPRLVVDTLGYFEEHARAAVRSLLDAGHEFSAVVTAGDFNAIGAIQALRAAGRRVPEDVAVTGFDDVPSAQFADPPLTTVRQRPEVLGQLAAETLLAMIAGQPVNGGEMFAPTALIRRRSCGCDTTQALPLADTDALRGIGWQANLVTQLVVLAHHPLPLDPGVPPDQVWPGAARLVDGLASILRGEAAPETRTIEQAWREAVALMDNLDILYAMLKLLESAAAQQLGEMPEKHSAHAQAATFLDRARLAMMRARLDRESLVTDVLDQTARTYQALDAALLGDQAADTIGLDWLDQTLAEWACLGLWDSSAGSAEPTLKIAGLYQPQGLARIVPGSTCPAAAFPPAELVHAAPISDAPSNVVLLPVATAAHAWGVLALRLPTEKQITYDLHGLKLLAPRLGAKLERESLLRSLREQQETLTYAYERERALTSTIREIGSPVIPLLDHVLLVPLVGAIDSNRAQQIVEAVLDGVGQHQADVILLDVTGVPLVDTQVASSLIQTAQAARLLGARTIMVGVRPEIAQSIVGLGVDLRQIETHPTLAAALTTLINAGRATNIRRAAQADDSSFPATQ